jgi:hypothetical protein
MGCCGQGRAALVQGRANRQQVAAIMIRGPATGRHYQFNPGAQTQWVDPRDAASLLKSGYFRSA